MKTTEDYKKDIEKHGADTITILIQKYHLNSFDQGITGALIEAYQQGASKAIEVTGEIAKTTIFETSKNPDEIPF